MMTSLAQAHSSPHPGGIQHPGGFQGHPMQGAMAVPHSQGQGQPGMPQQMHMGVSGPGGPQVSQAGALIGSMPPGAGGPSAHALQHLNPQAQMLQQQQQAAMFANPQFHIQQQQQQQLMNQQRAVAARQAMIQQQYSGGGGMPMNMQNGMGQMTPAQYQAMRGAGPMRPVNLPQHLQQQQQQAQQSLEHQQAQQAQQQQQQQLMQQQMAMQHANAQAAGGNNNPGQQGQMNPQQMHNLQQAQLAAQQQHQQQGQAVSSGQPNQPPQAQSQPLQQQPQPNAQGQPQQPQQPAAQQPQGLNAQQQAQAQAAALMQQQRQQGDKLRGQCLMRLMQFGDHLSNFSNVSKPLSSYMSSGVLRMTAQGNKQKDDLQYWTTFVNQFFSPKGVLRHSLWLVDESSNKQYEITFPALARYFHTHFESGVKTMQFITEKAHEKDLPNNGHYIESAKSSFIYWFDNGAQLVATGSLRAHFDAEQKIELLDFVTTNHEEYLPRNRVIEAARPVHDWAKEWQKVNAPPEGKQSPEMNKKKAKAMKSPPQPPPEIDIPQTKVNPKMGITPAVFRFLELAEVIVQMNPLFNFSHQHTSLAPYSALDQYITTVAANGGNPGAQGQNPSGPRTPGMPNFPMGTSPAAAHLQLPGSPHIGGSPAQAPGMQLQQSQHGTSSSGPSANTSPNASNKRRRPSAVKTEEENQVNGTQAKPGVKPSPRITKRQKPNNAS